MLLAQRLKLVGIEGEMTIQVGSDETERKILADAKKFGWHCLNTFVTDGLTWKQRKNDLRKLVAYQITAISRASTPMRWPKSSNLT